MARLKIYNGTDFEYADAGSRALITAATNRGDEWARVNLPSGSTFSNIVLGITSAPTIQSDAPSQMSGHTGSGNNIRITPNWYPPFEMIGWWFIPVISAPTESTLPARVFYPLNNYSPVFINFNSTASPSTFFGCMAQWKWDEDNDYQGLTFSRFNANVGLPSNAQVRIRPALATSV